MHQLSAIRLTNVLFNSRTVRGINVIQGHKPASQVKWKLQEFHVKSGGSTGVEPYEKPSDVIRTVVNDVSSPSSASEIQRQITELSRSNDTHHWAVPRGPQQCLQIDKDHESHQRSETTRTGLTEKKGRWWSFVSSFVQTNSVRIHHSHVLRH